MKEASGELSMTLIVLIGAGLVIALLTFMWPSIQQFIENQWGKVKTVDTDKMVGDNHINGGMIVIRDYNIFVEK